MIKNNFFKNKYVLITGGGSGIGYQIAKDFLDRGSNVAVHYNKNLSGAKKILKYGGQNKCKIFKADLSKIKEISKLWNNYLKWSKNKIDILVNNAAFVKPMEFTKLTSIEWDKTLFINVRAAFLLSQSAFKIMSKKKNQDTKN